MPGSGGANSQVGVAMGVFWWCVVQLRVRELGCG